MDKSVEELNEVARKVNEKVKRNDRNGRIFVGSSIAAGLIFTFAIFYLALFMMAKPEKVVQQPTQKSIEQSQFDPDKPLIIDHGNGVAFIYLGNLPGSKEIPFYAEKFETPFAK